MHLITEITYRCPASCSFCPLKKEKYPNHLSIHNFKKALKLFSEIGKRKLLTISGGEPTVIRTLSKYVEVAHDYGYVVTVATNCYNPEKLLEAKPDYVQISIDAVGEQHDSSRGLMLWHNVLKVLEYVKAGELKGFVRFTLTKYNINELYILRSRLDALGIKAKIFAMPIRGNPELLPDREAILNILKSGVAILPTRCPAGKGQFVITPDKRVLDCIFHREELGTLKKFDVDELAQILEKGKKLKEYPCGEPYWWSEGDLRCRTTR